jgi:hypothetical protein
MCLFVTLFSSSLAFAEMEKIKKAETFVMFTDYSGSMGLEHSDMDKKKITLAKEFMIASSIWSQL